MLLPTVALALLVVLAGLGIVRGFRGTPVLGGDLRRSMTTDNAASADRAKLTLFISGPSIGNALFRAELKKELTFFRGRVLLRSHYPTDDRPLDQAATLSTSSRTTSLGESSLPRERGRSSRSSPAGWQRCRSRSVVGGRPSRDPLCRSLPRNRSGKRSRAT